VTRPPVGRRGCGAPRAGRRPCRFGTGPVDYSAGAPPIGATGQDEGDSGGWGFERRIDRH
jgi:hypothetical protein